MRVLKPGQVKWAVRGHAAYPGKTVLGTSSPDFQAPYLVRFFLQTFPPYCPRSFMKQVPVGRGFAVRPGRGSVHGMWAHPPSAFSGQVLGLSAAPTPTALAGSPSPTALPHTSRLCACLFPRPSQVPSPRGIQTNGLISKSHHSTLLLSGSSDKIKNL